MVLTTNSEATNCPSSEATGKPEIDLIYNTIYFQRDLLTYLYSKCSTMSPKCINAGLFKFVNKSIFFSPDPSN
jgi:hypothetical protein